MAWFLVKSDPDEYSFEDLARDGTTLWDGVHSFAAMAFIKQMQVGDPVLVYHSQKQKAIVGIAEVADKPFLNTDDPRLSWAVRLRYVATLQTPVSLATLKSMPELSDFALIKQSRLSVMPVQPDILNKLQLLIPELLR